MQRWLETLAKNNIKLSVTHKGYANNIHKAFEFLERFDIIPNQSINVSPINWIYSYKFFY